MKKLKYIIFIILISFWVIMPVKATSNQIIDTADLYNNEQLQTIEENLNLFEANNPDFGILVYIRGSNDSTNLSQDDLFTQIYTNNLATDFSSSVVIGIDFVEGNAVIFRYDNALTALPDELIDTLSEQMVTLYNNDDALAAIVSTITDIDSYLTKYDENYDTSTIVSEDSILDLAGLFTSSEIADLETTINYLATTYNFQPVILTVDNTGSKSIADFAYDYYDYNDFGFNDSKDGILFMVAMDTREYQIVTTGSMINLISDRNESELLSSFQNDLASGDYYQAFKNGLDNTEDILQQPNLTIYYILGGSIGAGLIIATITLIILVRKMKTARKQTDASNYIKANSFHLRSSRDMYLYQTTSSTKKVKRNSGGGGSSFGSSGRSHGGGGGHF